MSIMLSRQKRIAFIVNPNAAMGSTGKEWPQIRSFARDRLGPFETHLTTAQGDAIGLTRQALLAGAEKIVCVGGDGTFNEVVNGFMGEDGPVRPEALLSYIPRGTGCDFIKTVPIPKELDKAMDLILESRARPIDLGQLSYRDHYGQPALRYFHNITSLGMGGEVDERVNRTTKAFGGFISFIWATLIALLIYKTKRVRLKIDDTLEQNLIIWHVVVANGKYQGGGMFVAPDATVDDGLFHVTVVGDLSLPEVFWHLPKLYNGKLLEVSKVSAFEARKVEADSDERVLLDVDGEQLGELPVVVEMVPGALPLIMGN